MKKTLVKSKIVLENNGETLTTYMWKKIFLCFGYWYPFGTCCGSKISKQKLYTITDDSVSKFYLKISFNNFI